MRILYSTVTLSQSIDKCNSLLYTPLCSFVCVTLLRFNEWKNDSKLVESGDLYVWGHVLAGLVLSQRRHTARVEDILPDERTRQPTDDVTFLLGGSDRRLDGGGGSRHWHAWSSCRRRYRHLTVGVAHRLGFLFDSRLQTSDTRLIHSPSSNLATHSR